MPVVYFAENVFHLAKIHSLDEHESLDLIGGERILLRTYSKTI